MRRVRSTFAAVAVTGRLAAALAVLGVLLDHLPDGIDRPGRDGEGIGAAPSRDHLLLAERGALGDRRTVQRKNPRRFGSIEAEEFRLFYNPMWSHFGDAVQPAGTYYYDKSNPEVDPLWNIFDQVLLRPGLVDRFRSRNLKILTTDGDNQFTWAEDGTPNGDVYSDHLPIWFKLDLRRRDKYAAR